MPRMDPSVLLGSTASKERLQLAHGHRRKKERLSAIEHALLQCTQPLHFCSCATCGACACLRFVLAAFFGIANGYCSVHIFLDGRTQKDHAANARDNEFSRGIRYSRWDWQFGRQFHATNRPIGRVAVTNGPKTKEIFTAVKPHNPSISDLPHIAMETPG